MHADKSIVRSKISFGSAKLASPMSYQHHLPNHLRRLLVGLTALLLGWLVVAGAAAQTTRNIAVIYPQLEEPYRSLLGKILQGIEQRTTERVIPMAISTPANPGEIAATLQSQNVRVIIALGRSGLRLARQLQQMDTPAVGMLVGSVVTVSEADVGNLTVATLAPDPAELLAYLGKFNPRIKRVFVVYDPSQNRWMLHLAKVAAAARGMELHAFEASDLRSTMQRYQNIFASMDARSDALWLPLDTVTVNDTIVLPFVLQEAWARNLVVFSSNLEHVRRGALFALYPDELAVGHHLAELALLQMQSTKSRPGSVLSLKNALLAVNTRTATHVGLDKANVQAGAQRVFPE